MFLEEISIYNITEKSMVNLHKKIWKDCISEAVSCISFAIFVMLSRFFTQPKSKLLE